MADSNFKEDLPFRHYTLKHRLIAWISLHLFDTATGGHLYCQTT